MFGNYIIATNVYVYATRWRLFPIIPVFYFSITIQLPFRTSQIIHDRKSVQMYNTFLIIVTFNPTKIFKAKALYNLIFNHFGSTFAIGEFNEGKDVDLYSSQPNAREIVKGIANGFTTAFGYRVKSGEDIQKAFD